MKETFLFSVIIIKYVLSWGSPKELALDWSLLAINFLITRRKIGHYVRDE